VYRLAREAENGWERICGFERIAAMEAGVVFKDGIAITEITMVSSPPPERSHTPDLTISRICSPEGEGLNRMTG